MLIKAVNPHAFIHLATTCTNLTRNLFVLRTE